MDEGTDVGREPRILVPSRAFCLYPSLISWKDATSHAFLSFLLSGFLSFFCAVSPPASSAAFCTAPHHTAKHNTAPHCNTLYRTVPYRSASHHTQDLAAALCDSQLCLVCLFVACGLFLVAWFRRFVVVPFRHFAVSSLCRFVVVFSRYFAVSSLCRFVVSSFFFCLSFFPVVPRW